MVKAWKNPVFVSALILGALIYSKILPVKEKNPFSSPVPAEKIIFLSGKVSSNPVKSDFFGGTYKVCLDVFYARSNDSGGQTDGKAEVFIPKEIVEANYPGKLYTSAKTSAFPLIENGARISCGVGSISRNNLSRNLSGKNQKNVFLATSVKEIENKSSFSLFGLLESRIIKFRSLCRLQFKRLMYEWGNAGGLLLALVSGSREYTEKDVGAAFKNAGLSHILALSGMHLSLFGGIALFFGKKVSTRKIAAGIQLGAVVFFVWFAGISPSLFRAFLSALIIFAASLLRINAPEGLSVLSLSFLIHIVIFPEHIFDAGFMLSYSSLAGIIILSKFVKKIIHPAVPFKVRSSLADSASAQISTAPVALSLFGKIMPVGIFAGVVVSPLVVLFLYLGLAEIVLCLFLPFLSGPFSDIMNKVYYIIKMLVLFFSRFS